MAKILADRQGRTAVEKILSENKGEVGRLLAANRHIVEALRDALLARHELIGDEILDVIRMAETKEPTAETVEIIDLREVPGTKYQVPGTKY